MRRASGILTGLAIVAAAIGFLSFSPARADVEQAMSIGIDIPGGDFNRFNQLFPLGHKYMGFMDLFGRRNIETANAVFTVQPHEKVTLLAWYYYFWLENRNDVPYTVVMTPYQSGRPASADLGHELDLLATIAFSCSSMRSAALSGNWADRLSI